MLWHDFDNNPKYTFKWTANLYFILEYMYIHIVIHISENKYVHMNRVVLKNLSSTPVLHTLKDFKNAKIGIHNKIY